MNKQNTDKLFRTFPSLYQTVARGPFFSIRQRCQEIFSRWLPIRTPNLRESLMRFGFEHSDGWFDIIWRLSADLAENFPRQVKAIQVKQKYGTLRFYEITRGVDETYKEVNKRIDVAEAESAVTCEVCGAPGELYAAGCWVKTLCGNINCTDGDRYTSIGKEGNEDD